MNMRERCSGEEEESERDEECDEKIEYTRKRLRKTKKEDRRGREVRREKIAYSILNSRKSRRKNRMHFINGDLIKREKENKTMRSEKVLFVDLSMCFRVHFCVLRTFVPYAMSFTYT